MLFIALISVITVSCKDTEKEEIKDAISTEVEAAKDAVGEASGEAVYLLSANVKDAHEAAKKKLEEGTKL